MEVVNTRPLITDYSDPVAFLRDVLSYRKQNDRGFSVLVATKKLRRVSPALVSLVLKGERKLTLDRADEFAKLLNLNAQEKSYFKVLIEPALHHDVVAATTRNRKEVGTHILSDWINVYVKDCFQLPQIQNKPALVYRHLAAYASPRRIEKSLQFLLKEGHLRKTPEGRIVTETPLALAQSPVASKKIRQFHKGALDIARASLDFYPPSERLANTLTIPLNEKTYAEFLSLIEDFALKAQNFAAENSDEGNRLYQLILNLSPAGGKIE